MKNIILLELQAQDFENVNFLSCTQCAIGKAVQRQIGIVGYEGINSVRFPFDSDDPYNDDNVNKDIIYLHPYYGVNDFGSDRVKASALQDKTTVVRTIQLTRK